ncbi:hypothetical protein CIG75_17490 [Tumebacillus algifaecis]|uniref:CRISPR-associated protein Cas6 C-terminal domain-containing protein n=1 Tax=Tumebacillus algifaecis TaxID=1214604 RepID=A0A223D4N7_9BACL|nr:CRISPR system precrRNA processing endoribonuclease RAMP protein Cas6 [Tumebacillus algifaecis]ASS76579.1 hypothetical protein CIG75_17490 [Tumebacillus algifaecis]
MLENLTFTTYRFTLQVGKQGLELPAWKASTFRGGFGHIFKKRACMRAESICDRCEASSTCAYGYIFETSPDGETGGFMGRYDQIPRPYLLEVPSDRQTFYEPGELLSLRLRLFGRGIDYAPLFISTFRELGIEGIGKGRKPYRLIHVATEDVGGAAARTLYMDGEHQLHDPILATGADIIAKIQPQSSHSRLTLFFETPLRMKWQGRYTSDPQFHVIFRNILRRVTGLLQYHHGIDTSTVNYRGLIEKAEQIQLVRQETRWVDYDRFSARQDSKMKLGGMMGWAQYEGEWEAFLPWLKVAEIIHLGKNTAFDLGRIRIG